MSDVPNPSESTVDEPEELRGRTVFIEAEHHGQVEATRHGAYFLSLRDQGIPAVAARELTREWMWSGRYDEDF